MLINQGVKIIIIAIYYMFYAYLCLFKLLISGHYYNYDYNCLIDNAPLEIGGKYYQC